MVASPTVRAAAPDWVTMISATCNSDLNLTDVSQEPRRASRGLSSRNRKLDSSIVSYMKDGSGHMVSEMRAVFPRATRQQLVGALNRLNSKGIVNYESGPEFRVYRLAGMVTGDERIGEEVQGDAGIDGTPPVGGCDRGFLGGG